MKKFNFSKAEKIVIKLGSSIVTNNGNGLDERCLSSLIRQISILCSQNKKVILVSSGAIAAGLKKLGIGKRPKILAAPVEDISTNLFSPIRPLATPSL